MEHIDQEKISKQYRDFLNLYVADGEQEFLPTSHSIYKMLVRNDFTYDKHRDNRFAIQFQFFYDIECPSFKSIIFTDNHINIKKFKAVICNNIFLSKIIKGRRYNDFVKSDEFEGIFKEILTKYVEDNGGNFAIEYTELEMKLERFDKAYDFAFKTCEQKNRRCQKSKLKTQYRKYLEEGMDDCKLKEQLYLIIAVVELI